MKIIEYNDKYIEDCRDLLVELEEYIVSIDEDHLDQLGKDYREKMILYNLKELKENDGICYLAIENDKAIGLIMGLIVKYDEEDYLDYKCPKKGRITELIVSKNARGKNIGKELMTKMEDYLKSKGCLYINIEVFAYNKHAIDFYKKGNYHARCIDLIKKV